jgi:hypothetical protein
MTPLWLRVDRAPLTLAELPWRVALYRAQGVVRPAPSWPIQAQRRRAWRETLGLAAWLLAATAAASVGWWGLDVFEGFWRR